MILLDFFTPNDPHSELLTPWPWTGGGCLQGQEIMRSCLRLAHQFCDTPDMIGEAEFHGWCHSQGLKVGGLFIPVLSLPDPPLKDV